MKAVWSKNVNWRFVKLFVTAGAGLSILEISSKRPRSRDNISHCDVISKDSDHQRGHQIKNLKLVLNRNFIAEAADAASPAVVTIACEAGSTFGIKRMCTGSGFIYSKGGYVITNAHVVEHANDGICLVTMWDSTRRRGVVHSLDKYSDIAIIKLTDVSYGENLPVATIGSSGNLRVGEFVIALGSPGHLSNSITFGIVSATARHGSDFGLAGYRFAYIQTDAAINSGNSGGPLVNLDGEVVGINSMKIKGSDGISFAIPIDPAVQVIKQLIANKRVIRPYIGMTLYNYNESTNEILPTVDLKGVYNTNAFLVIVNKVDADSPAARAGIRRGDEVLEINGKKVRMVLDISSAIGYEVGASIKLKIKKPSGVEADVVVTTVSGRQR